MPPYNSECLAQYKTIPLSDSDCESDFVVKQEIQYNLSFLIKKTETEEELLSDNVENSSIMKPRKIFKKCQKVTKVSTKKVLLE